MTLIRVCFYIPHTYAFGGFATFESPSEAQAFALECTARGLKTYLERVT